MKTIAFFGHRRIINKQVLQERLLKTLKIFLPKGFSKLLIGCHGEFDKLSLSVCLNYKQNLDQNVQVCVVLTSLSSLNKGSRDYSRVDMYKDRGCETVFYDIENEYYKNRITFSNKRMVDNSDLIICYVDMNAYKSGAKTAINYAMKQNKTVINLFKEEDRIK